MRLQGLAVMRPASKVALRALLDGKRLVQFIPGQARQFSFASCHKCKPGFIPCPIADIGLFSPTHALTQRAACLSQEGQHLELTHKGRAVYDSALPLDDAMQLYESCTAADNGEGGSGRAGNRILYGYLLACVDLDPLSNCVLTSGQHASALVPGPAPPSTQPCPGFMLDRPLVLVYHCLLGHPFQIISWAEWGRLLQGLDKHEQ